MRQVMYYVMLVLAIQVCTVAVLIHISSDVCG